MTVDLFCLDNWLSSYFNVDYTNVRKNKTNCSWIWKNWPRILGNKLAYMNRISRINYDRFTTVLAFSIYIIWIEIVLFIKEILFPQPTHLCILTSHTGSLAAASSPSEAQWQDWGRRGHAGIRLLFAEFLQTITGLVSISEKWENCILFPHNNNTTSRQVPGATQTLSFILEILDK